MAVKVGTIHTGELGLASTVSRQPPHMPVPSIMIGFMLTTVLMPNSWSDD
jgi:hypothetical protein